MKQLAADIYASGRALPLWVQIWVFFILIPVNLVGLFFWNDPVGRWIGVLGVLGMLPNVLVMIYDRGFTDKMALPHLIPWTMLVVWLVTLLCQGRIDDSSNVYTLAWCVVIVNTISLIFDYKDAFTWLVSGPKK